MKKERLEQIRRLWEKEDDKWLIKALCQDLGEYPEEVICIVREIAEKRNLIQRGAGPNESVIPTIELSRAGADIKSEQEQKAFNRKPSVVIHRLITAFLLIINILIWAMSYIMAPVERQIRLEKECKTGFTTWCCFGMGIFVSILLICACIIEMNELGDELFEKVFELSVKLYFLTIIIGIISLVFNTRKIITMNTKLLNCLLTAIGLVAGPVMFVGLIIFMIVHSILTGTFMGNAR